MILVIDSGSTNTRVNAVDREKIRRYSLSGINPYYQTEDDIFTNISTLNLDYESITHIFHYGAGCSFDEKKNIVKNAWKRLCVNATVEVDSDMVAAAKALFEDGSGVACILGTGANSCYFEEGRIVENIPPLGFILGDEGSGAFLGAKLVANCMKGIYKKEMTDAFYKCFNTNSQEIMDGVYKRAFPNRFMASFVPFISENIKTQEMESLVKESFRLFFERNVVLYEQTEKKIGFVGGVAKQFEHQLKTVANEFGYTNVCIMADPIDELVRYHKKKMMCG